MRQYVSTELVTPSPAKSRAQHGTKSFLAEAGLGMPTGFARVHTHLQGRLRPLDPQERLTAIFSDKKVFPVG